MNAVPLTIAIAFVIAGVVAGVWSSMLSIGRKKGYLILLSGCAVGAAFCWFSVCNIVGIHTSQHLFVTGQLNNLTQTHGRGSHSNFYVGDSRKRLRADYAGNRLENGQTVSVEFLDYDGALLHLKVLNGSYAGWTLDEGDGTISSVFTCALGLFLIFGAGAKWKRDPEGREQRGRRRDVPDGGDSQSLIHLSDSDNHPDRWQ